MADGPDVTEKRFRANLARVGNLVALYDGVNADRGQGKPATDASDILRAAVVLLHATLEDLVRSLEYDLLPRSPASAFNDVGLAPSGAGDDEKAAMEFGLDLLVGYRGRSVDDVLRGAAEFHLRLSNYNNAKQLMGVLGKYKLTLDDPTRALLSTLDPLMKRRHWIAHRADANPLSGPGRPKTQSISRSSVTTWTAHVQSFGEAIIKAWRTWSPS